MQNPEIAGLHKLDTILEWLTDLEAQGGVAVYDAEPEVTGGRRVTNKLTVSAGAEGALNVREREIVSALYALAEASGKNLRDFAVRVEFDTRAVAATLEWEWTEALSLEIVGAANKLLGVKLISVTVTEADGTVRTNEKHFKILERVESEIVQYDGEERKDWLYLVWAQAEIDTPND